MDIVSLLETVGNVSFLGFNHWEYLVIFLGVFLEEVPLLGLFAPGMVVVITGGFMVKLGIFDVGDLIVVASLAAILGDLMGYLLGRKYGESVIEKYGKYFFFRREQYNKIKTLVNKHTGKSVIIGRFNSLTRAFAPFIAGSTNVPLKQFMLYNIIGGIMWSVSFVAVGFVFGESYESVSGYVGKSVAAAVVLSIGIVYSYRFINKRKHIFSKYHLYILSLNIFSLYLFSKMVEDVITKDRVTTLDVWLNQKVTTWWSPNLNDVFIFITNIASPLHLSLLAIVLAVVFLVQKKWYFLVLLTTGMIGGLLLKTIIKLLMHRDRPVNHLIEASGYSFPSGHATMAIIFFLVVLFAFKDDIKNTLVWSVFTVSCIIAFVLIGFSRVYLNVHWFSDVIAGFALGAFWLTVLVLIFKFIIAIATRSLNKLKAVLAIT